jgi:hypothetical protein
MAVSMGVGAASGCYPKRAEVDKTTVVTRAPAARVPALWAADVGKSAATLLRRLWVQRARSRLQCP